MASLPQVTTGLTRLGNTAYLTPATKTTPEQEFRTNLKDGFKFELDTQKTKHPTLASLPAHIPESLFDRATTAAPIGLGREPFLTALMKEVTEYKTKPEAVKPETQHLLGTYQGYIQTAIDHITNEASA